VGEYISKANLIIQAAGEKQGKRDPLEKRNPNTARAASANPKSNK